MGEFFDGIFNSRVKCQITLLPTVMENFSKSLGGSKIDNKSCVMSEKKFNFSLFSLNLHQANNIKDM
jgi:hypothetical protein